MTYLQLGTYKFQGVKLPQSWGQNYEMGYEEIGVVGGKPVVQRTGEKLDTIELTAYFTTDFCKPQDEIDALNLIRKNGEVFSVVDGNGRNYGKFVLKNVSVGVENSLPNGYLTAANVTISLLEYNTNEVITVSSGLAIAGNNPAEETPIIADDNLTVSLQKDITSGKRNAEKVNTESKKTTKNYSKIVTFAQDAKAAYQSANTKIEQTKKTVYRAQELQGAITSTIAALDDVISAGTIESPNDLLLVNSRMNTAVYQAEKANAPVVALIGSREGGDE